MGIDDSTRPHRTDPPATEPHAPQPCPRCGLTDRVRSVPAVHLEGRSRVSGRFQATDRYQRTTATGLSDALAPSPEAFMPAGTPILAWLAVTAVVGLGTFCAGAVNGGWFDDRSAMRAYPDTSVYGWISALAACLALSLFIVVVGRIRALRDVAAGRAKALSPWSASWYCSRCGTVHLQGSAALSLQEFRTMVWETGDYGELAVEYPVL